MELRLNTRGNHLLEFSKQSHKPLPNKALLLNGRSSRKRVLIVGMRLISVPPKLTAICRIEACQKAD
jgi:hypothetical protein